MSTSLDLHRFYRTLEDWRSRSWDWNDANCCQFVSDVLRCWSIEHAVPACDTPAEAQAWLADQGCRNLYQYLVRQFAGPVAPLRARRGWILYRKGVGLEGSAIGTVDRKGLFVGDHGLVEMKLSTAAVAFDPGKYRG